METANDAAMEKFHFGIVIGISANVSGRMTKDYPLCPDIRLMVAIPVKTQWFETIGGIIMNSFSQRSNLSELLDDPTLGGDDLIKNLEDIARVNRWLGGEKALVSAIAPLLEQHDFGRPIEVVDLGCGSGDLPRAVVKWCRRKNIPVSVTAVDINDSIIRYATSQSKDFPEIRFEKIDVFSDEFKKRRFDIVVMSLFLHHFDNRKAEELLKNSYEQCRLAVVVNDLHRSPVAYHLFELFAFVTASSTITRHDGLISILRGFRKKDLERLTDEFSEAKRNIKWKWAFRWQLALEKEIPATERV
jgi:SAM-dependent methyltransferase